MTRGTTLRVSLFLALAFIFTPAAARAGGEDTALATRAEALGIASDPQWLALLHVVPGSSKSEIDDPNFFLAPNGKYDSAAELGATISGLFKSGPENDSVQCRFPARYRWLRERLPISPSEVRPLACAEFEKWQAAINPHGLTLIFPTALPNSPASAFGHTLLRIDSPAGSDEETLPNYTANYAAETHGENAIIYAFKGTVGGYSGYFSVAPYYEKVKQYSDLENRDIWEYELNVTPEEVARMVAHLWELRRIGLDYYYFDENCAYELLSLLDAARPSLNLQSKFHGWIIPVDTVRVMTEVPGFIKNQRFRPSAATVLLKRMEEAPAAQRGIAKGIVLGEAPLAAVDPLPPESRADTLDLAYDFLTYKKIKARDESAEVRDLGYAILRARSKTGVKAHPIRIDPPLPPEKGHGTSKVAVGFGIDSDKPYYEIGLRPAYHDLLDPGNGYTSGAQIQFLDLALREESGRPLELSRMTLLDITSITPRNDLLKPWSWQVSTGLRRDRWSYEEQPLLGHGLVRFGAAALPAPGVTAFLLAGPHLEAGPAFDAGYAIGAGAKAGVLTDPHAAFGVGASGEWERFNLGETFSRYSFGGEARYTLSQHFALRGKVAREQDLNSPSTRSLLSIEWFP